MSHLLLNVDSLSLNKIDCDNVCQKKLTHEGEEKMQETSLVTKRQMRPPPSPPRHHLLHHVTTNSFRIMLPMHNARERDQKQAFSSI